MATRDAGYTKTGNGWLTSLGNKISMVPFVGGVGGVLIFIDAALESAGWLLRGKGLSAVTSLAAGTVGAVSATATSAGKMFGLNPVWWGVNAVSGVSTGRSINTHARKLTEEAIGFMTKPLGVQPTVLRSYPAGIGSLGNGINSRSGFVAAEAARRGQTADAAWARINSNQPDHVAQLQAAGQQGWQAQR